MLKRALVVAALAGLGALAFAAVPACDDAETHVYSARVYEVDRDCVDDYGAIDVVSGGAVSSRCEPVCLTNAGVVYVSRVCPPYPPLFGVQTAEGGLDPTCAAALAALVRDDSCLPDAGSKHPIEGGTGDGGGDGGATDDGAANEAGADSASD